MLFRSELEYGTATIEVHKDSIDKDDSVLIIDDLMATVQGKQVKLEDVTKGMTRALEYYGQYIEMTGGYENAKKADQDGFTGDISYYKNRISDKAGEIKSILLKLTSGKIDGWW